MKRITLLLIFILSFYTKAQVFNQISEFGEFEEASSISINQQGKIFITDVAKNEIYKFDREGKKIREKGGYGWDSESFDFPCDISASTLSVYVADKNNNRIVFLDKDLNYLSEFSNDHADFAYPTSVDLTVQGDLQLLDSDNSQVLKFNIDGDFLLKLGDYESGEYVLQNPKKFRISSDFKTFVIGDSTLVIFDQFGAGLKKLPLDFDPINLGISGDHLFLNTEEELFYSRSQFEKIKFSSVLLLPKPNNIVQTCWNDGKLFVLTKNNVIVYTKSKN